MATTQRSTGPQQKGPPRTQGDASEFVALSLDDLAGMGPDDLMDLYRQARTPKPEDLDGKLVGRMLGVPRIQPLHVKKFLNRFARSGLFPWQAQTFSQQTERQRHGVNR